MQAVVWEKGPDWSQMNHNNKIFLAENISDSMVI